MLSSVPIKGYQVCQRRKTRSCLADKECLAGGPTTVVVVGVVPVVTVTIENPGVRTVVVVPAKARHGVARQIMTDR